MPIIDGALIDIPEHSGHADRIIQAMEQLLNDRRAFRVGRRAFLRRWDRLRVALFLTRDYGELRTQVCHESHGLCELCTTRVGQHMHHLVPVAFDPRLALVRSNVQWVCSPCHKGADRLAKQVYQREAADGDRARRFQ